MMKRRAEDDVEKLNARDMPKDEERLVIK